MAVKSVYNFVPAPDEKDVFKPDWADQVSHDIPFSDGESGEIELKITAETPLFIRNGHSKDQEENEFSHFVNKNGEKKYFIPATSLKGMFRNVLEIISSARLNKKLVDDDRYSFRDLTQGSLYMKTYKSSEVKGGWLKEDSKGNWVIEEVDLYHIHHSEVDKALGTDFRKEFLNKNPEEKTAKYKYKKSPENLTRNFLINEVSNAVFDQDGKVTGTIVFTGQSSRRNDEGKFGKVHEFVFTNDVVEELIISTKQQKDFKFIYADGDSQNISPDWEYHKAKLIKGKKIPVFFMKDGDKKVKHFGLAFMYKLPYEHSIHEMLPISEYINKKDLSELVFGDIEKDDSLKGRVMIGNAWAVQAVPFDKLQKEILGGPKASYFPFYVKQKNVSSNGYTTYQDKAEIRGFKRYPVRSKNTLSKFYTPKQLKNEKVFSHFIPLKSGAEFKLKIRFHNLRKIEIGALFSAISFHNNLNCCYHSLGGAKPFGYGKIKILNLTIRNLHDDFEEYLLTFEKAMDENHFKAQLKELLAMASNTKDETLDYPVLDMDKKQNDFNNYKNQNEYLYDFSNINPFEIVSLEDKEKKEKEERESIEKQKAEQDEKALADSLKDSNDIEALERFVSLYPFNEHTPIFKIKMSELYTRKKKQKAEELQKELILVFPNAKFKDTKDILNGYIKKNKHFEYSDAQKDQIETQIKSCWTEDSDAFCKKGKLINFPKFPWTDIIKWLGKARVQDLYEELNPS